MTVEEERKIVRLSREGKSMADISRELRRSKDSVHDALILHQGAEFILKYRFASISGNHGTFPPS